jgi:hypothetical protein
MKFGDRYINVMLPPEASRSYESHWKKMIGKPYSGKPNVRFDEGELEIELLATTSALCSAVIPNPFCNDSFL